MSKQEIRKPPSSLTMKVEEKEFSTLESVKLFLSFAIFLVRTALHSFALYLGSTLRRIFLQEPVSVKGKVCLVTGSGRGLGRELCLELARNGAILACIDLNEVTNRETLELLTQVGATARAYTANIAYRSEVEEVVKKVEEELGPIYLVVNNAALVLPPSSPSEEFVRASFNVNVLGNYWIAEEVLRYLKTRNVGHIIFIGSISSLCSIYGLDVYSATKAALRSLAWSLNKKLRLEGSDIKVSMVHPTFTNTSQDYADSMKSRFRFISTPEVVSSVMSSIKYGYFEFTVPSYFKWGLILLQELPKETYLLLLRISKTTAIIPNMSEYMKLPSGKIVSVCCNGTPSSEASKEKTV